mgnify:CR=1 FL=1|tara:strand:- start:527 stop:826 length:300 start_codon:yes stop_codon:yes gene_type:complete
MSRESHYDPADGEFVDFEILDDWQARDVAKDAEIERLWAALRMIASVEVVNVDSLGRPLEVMIHDNDVRVPWVIAREALGLQGNINAAIEELRGETESE